MQPPEESDSSLEPTDYSTASAEDEDTLRRSHPPTGETEHIGLPSEPVTFNIGNVEGKEIQFGDRHIITYVTVDAIKIRNLIARSPYKGLKPFEKDDTDRFFGRTAFVEKLFHELRSSNLLLLLGASGSGKSSVIRAGLIPRLAQAYARFMALTLTPGQDPFEGLYTSLYPRFQEKAALAREGKEDTLLQVVRSLKPADEQWFLLLDQFEELFTTSAPERQKPFIAGMVRLNEVLAKEQNRSVQIIATMRSDFSHQLNEYPRLVNALKNQCLMITAMQPDELRLAIEQPAAKHGVVFEKELMIGHFAAQPEVTVEEGLVAQMMKDVQGQPGYLPLLQYTLDLLWETERQSGGLSDRTLNISTYQQLGGVRGALQKHVDEIYGKLTNAEQLAAQRIFLKLVEIGGDEASGTSWKAVRKRALRPDFADPTEQDVLARLIDAKLLVSNAPVVAEKGQLGTAQTATVEIAHEVLLTSWKTLEQWITGNRKAIALRNRINDDAEHWQKQKQEGDLLPDSRLAQALELKTNETFQQVLGGFSDIEEQLIVASQQKRDRQLRRTRIVAGVLVGLATLTSAAGLVAVWLWQDAQRQSIFAATQTTEARLNLDEPFEGKIEALRAAKQFSDLWMGKAEVGDRVAIALRKAFYDTPERNRFEGHQGVVTSVSFSPDGKTIASASWDNTVKLWSLDGKELQTLKGHQNSVFSVSFSPDGKTIASASTDETVKLWSLNGKELHTLKGHQGLVYSVSFSPDGKMIASASEDETVKLWSLDGKELQTLTGLQSWVYSVSFSPDGKTIASVSSDSTVKLWSLDGKELQTLKGNSLSFSPDGKTIALVSPDRTVKLWSLNGKELQPLKGLQGDVYSVSFSPDGKTIALSRGDKTVQLWSLNGKELQILKELQGDVHSVSFSPDGKTIASESGDKAIKLWSLDGKLLHTFTGHQDRVNSVSFSPDGKTLASASSDNTIKLWDLDPARLRALGCSQIRGYLETNPNVSEGDRHLCDGVGTSR